MNDIATLGLAVDSSGVKQANIELRNFSQTSSASERAAEKFVSAANAAGKSSEEFSRRVKRNIDTLEFQRQQMTRSAAEQERYNALRRAGVTAESAAGQAITANIRAIQAQRQAQEQAAEAAKVARTQAAGYAALAQRQAAESATASQRQAAETAAAAQQQARAAKQRAEDEVRQVAQRRALAMSVASDLNFERQQLTRNAAARERYSALRRAGVTESSAEGRAIVASVTALQAQRAAVQKSEDQTRKSAAATREFANQWRGTIAALVGTVGAGGIMKAADSFTALTNAIKVSGAEGASLVFVQDRLFTAANKNGVEIDALGQLYSRVAMAGRELGTSQEGILEFIDGVTAALRVQGGSTESARGALLQLSQALGSGVVRAEEFNSILEGALPIAQAAARGMDGMGGSVAKLRTAILDGKVTSQQFFEATMKGFDETRRQAESASLTIGQALTSLSNSFISYVGNVDKASGVSAAFAKAISAVGKSLDEAGKNSQVGNGGLGGTGLFDLSKMLESTVKEIEAIIRMLDALDKWMSAFAMRTGAALSKAVDAFAVEGARGSAMFLEAFRVLPDSLGKLFVDGMNKAVAAVEAGLREITAAIANSWLGRRLGIGADDAPTFGRLTGGGFSLSNTSAQVSGAGEVAANQMRGLQERRRLIDRQAAMQDDEARARLGGMAAVGPIGLGGGTKPTSKGGGSDPYAKAIESAKEYVLTKRAETEAIGKSALEAARLKHEQELLNKAMGDGKTITEAQKAALQGLAAQMAAADNELATAKFMDDAKTKSEEFIANQELEARSLFMTAEAAAKLRYETELLNEARRQGIELTPEKVAAIQADASAMAAAEARTKQLREAFEFAKSTTTEFFADIRNGLLEGQTIWEAFGNAAVNALTKISDKLFEIAANKLVEQAFGGLGGGGGGGGGLFGFIGGLFGGGGVSASGPMGIGDIISGAGGLAGGWMPGFAKGAAFKAGNVVPFANGGVVSAPTTFPMARGRTGVMGEAGPEAIMPLRRGADGRLGIEAANSNGRQSGRVDIYIHDATEMLNLTIDNRADVRIARASPKIVKSSTSQSRREVKPTIDRHHAEQDGEWRGAA